MTHRLIRFLLVPLAVVAAALVGLGAPASADTENHRDPRGDVARVDTARAAPFGLDLVRVHNRFSDGKLVVQAELADVAKHDWTLAIVVMTDDGSRYRGQARKGKGDGFVFGGASPHYGGRCRETDRFAHHTLTFIYSRACYRGVPWVRVAAFTTRSAGDGVVYRDDAHQGRLHSGDRVQFGPRLDYTA